MHIEWEILRGSGLVLSQVLDKLRLLWYKTGSKQSLATTALISEIKANYQYRQLAHANVKKE